MPAIDWTPPRMAGKPIGEVAFQLARALKAKADNLKSFGGASNPILPTPDTARFTVDVGDGRRLTITIAEENMDDLLDNARAAREAKASLAPIRKTSGYYDRIRDIALDEFAGEDTSGQIQALATEYGVESTSIQEDVSESIKVMASA